jgi:hypothetical protein
MMMLAWEEGLVVLSGIILDLSAVVLLLLPIRLLVLERLPDCGGEILLEIDRSR